MSERAYLEEVALGRFLRERLDPDVVYNKTAPGIVGRYRPDYRSERHKSIIEFDGNQHYQRAANILRDIEKDAVFVAAGYRVIRIPYFVQLDSKVIYVVAREQCGSPRSSWVFQPAQVFAFARSRSAAGENLAKPRSC